MTQTNKSWYIVFVGDPRRISYLDNAFKTLHSEYTIWIPEYSVVAKNKRKNIVETKLKPLFPGYAFVYFNYENNRDIDDQLRFHCGGHFLKSVGTQHPYIMTSEEVATVKKHERSKEALKSIATQYDISQGDMVDIVQGLFQGLKGEVVSLKKEKIVVNINIFGRTVETDVDPSCCVVN